MSVSRNHQTLSRLFLFSLIAALSALLPHSAAADNYSEAANAFRNSEAAAPFFSQSYGYAVFPTVGKGGFILAGGYGRGRVFVAGDPVGDTTLTQASVGFQVPQRRSGLHPDHLLRG